MKHPPRFVPVLLTSIFRRVIHVQTFQSPCTCTKMRDRIFSSAELERANQELQNAFLDESLAQKVKGNMAMHF